MFSSWEITASLPVRGMCSQPRGVRWAAGHQKWAREAAQDAPQDSSSKGTREGALVNALLRDSAHRAGGHAKHHGFSRQKAAEVSHGPESLLHSSLGATLSRKPSLRDFLSRVRPCAWEAVSMASRFTWSERSLEVWPCAVHCMMPRSMRTRPQPCHPHRRDGGVLSQVAALACSGNGGKCPRHTRHRRWPPCRLA